MGVDSKSDEITKVLFVAANQADVHRAGALAFHMPKDVQMDIYYTHNWMRMEDELLMKSLKSMNVTLIDETNLSLYSYLQVQWNLLAREYSSSSLKGLSNWANLKSKDQLSELWTQYLMNRNYDLVISSYVFIQESRWQFLILLNYCEKLAKKFVQIPHAVSLHDACIPGKMPYKDQMKVADLHLFANDYDLRFRTQNMPDNQGNYLVTGDPALSAEYNEHLLSLYESKLPKYDCCIFIPSPQTLGIYKELDWAEWLESCLRINKSQRIALKCHPNSDSSSIKEKLAKHPSVDVYWKTVNALDLIMSSDVIMTTPSTVIFQAILCNKALLVIDNFVNGISRDVLNQLSAPVFDVNSRESKLIQNASRDKDKESLVRFAWGNKTEEPSERTWRTLSKMGMIDLKPGMEIQ